LVSVATRAKEDEREAAPTSVLVGLGKVGAVLRGGGNDNDAIVLLFVISSDRLGHRSTEEKEGMIAYRIGLRNGRWD
jgi:hypothetical protein